MAGFVVFVKRPADDGSREAVGREWSMDKTEAESFDEPMSIVRGMIQAIYAVIKIDRVNEWGADSDGGELAPEWAADLMTAAGIESLCGSWVEVDGEPFAFVVAVNE